MATVGVNGLTIELVLALALALGLKYLLTSLTNNLTLKLHAWLSVSCFIRWYRAGQSTHSLY